MITCAMATSTASPTYDYDLIVIGGGSGGMASAKEAGARGFFARTSQFLCQEKARAVHMSTVVLTELPVDGALPSVCCGTL